MFLSALFQQNIPEDEVIRRIRESLSLKTEPLVLRKVFATAINAQMPQEVIPAEEKAKIYGLSVKIYQNHEVNLTSDDVTFIKTKVGKVYGALIYGKICDLFDPPPLNSGQGVGVDKAS